MINKSLIGAAVAAAMFTLSAPASATLTNWYVDTNGTAADTATAGMTSVSDYLNLAGKAYIQNSFSSANNFTFKESAYLNVVGSDDSPFLSGLTSTFIATGSGTVSSPAGSLTFNPGAILALFDGATQIGAFSLTSGDGFLNPGSVLPNGDISFIFKAISLTAGYFFDSSHTDLSSVVTDPDGLLFGFATTNAKAIKGPVDANLVTGFNTAFGTNLTGDVNADGRNSLYVSNGGQFQFDVPEPSLLSLLGLGLLVAGFTTRRKSKV